MIINNSRLKKFEADFIRGRLRAGRLSHKAAFKIFEAMWQEAVSLGVLPSENPLEGIETDIKIARTLNKCLKKSSRV